MQITDLLNTDNDLPVSGVTSDSRRVKDGYLFAALPGNKVKGSEYIGDAINHGAKIILAEKGTALQEGSEEVVLIESENTRQDFAKIAAKFYRIQPEHILAVTGTSGKTCHRIKSDSGL